MAKLPDGHVFIYKPKRTKIEIEERELVMCKNCVRRGNPRKCIVAKLTDKKNTPYFVIDDRGEWFCADGVAKDIDVHNKEG